MHVDDRWLDLDFTKQPEYMFGAKDAAPLRGYTAYEDSFEVLSSAEIDAGIDRLSEIGGGADRLVTRIYDQNGEGSCVANACGQAMEITLARQFGKDAVTHLAAISLYKRIGRSPSSGASVADGLDELVERGILPLDNEANRARFGQHVMPNIGYSTRYPEGWQDTALNFRIDEYYIVRSVAGMMTALCNGFPVVVGRQGHSICYVRPFRDGGKRLVYYANSWGNWGQGLGDFRRGFGVDTERQIGQSSSWAFAVRSVVTPKHLRPKKG